MGGAEEQFANEAMTGAIGEHGGVQMTNDQGSESIGGMEETQTVGEGEGGGTGGMVGGMAGR